MPLAINYPLLLLFLANAQSTVAVRANETESSSNASSSSIATSGEDSPVAPKQSSSCTVCHSADTCVACVYANACVVCVASHVALVSLFSWVSLVGFNLIYLCCSLAGCFTAATTFSRRRRQRLRRERIETAYASQLPVFSQEIETRPPPPPGNSDLPPYDNSQNYYDGQNQTQPVMDFTPHGHQSEAGHHEGENQARDDFEGDDHLPPSSPVQLRGNTIYSHVDPMEDAPEQDLS
jgi:hypothetical protein